MLYQSTCVGLGYGLMRGLFPGTPSLPSYISIERGQFAEFVTTRWPTNINVVPIDYAFRPRLRDRLTLRRLALRRNPWTYGDSVSHTVCRYSCQHSHFRCLQEPSRVSLHQAYGTLRYHSEGGRQTTDDRHSPRTVSLSLAGQALQHAGNHLIFVTPPFPGGFIDVTEIKRVSRPHSHFIA